MILQKAKGYPIKEKYQKSFSQLDVIVPKRLKRSNAMTEKNKKINKNGVKCTAPYQVIKFVGGHIYIFL